MQSILRRATRNPDGPWNILTFPTHERYESAMAQTGHNFYSIRMKGGKGWCTEYAPVPSNYYLLPESTESLIVPPWLSFDMVLSQSKEAHFPIARQIAQQLQIPIISLQHVLPPPTMPQAERAAVASMRGDTNVFVSEFQRSQWGYPEDFGEINYTGIDTEMFCPDPEAERQEYALSAVNNWIERDWCCGYKFWCETVGFPSPSPVIPFRVLGNTPGLSEAAPDIPTLVKFYQHARLYLNTTLVSSLPTVILEAMSCGCPVVSTDTCLIPKIMIKHGENGFVGSTPDELRGYCQMLLRDKPLAEKMGRAARKTIEEKFSQRDFVKKWNEIFIKTSKVYK